MTIEEKKIQLAKEFNTVSFKWINVTRGQELPYEFTHTNETEEIDFVKLNCGCTKPSLVEKDKIKGIFKTPSKGEREKYSTSMIVYFADGEPVHIVENGMQKDNPKKAYVIVNFKAEFKLL